MEQKIKALVRVLNTDIPGEKPLSHALTKIKGVNVMYSNAVCNTLNLKKDQKLGLTSEDQIKSIEEAITKPQEHNIPTWLLNRKSDPESGEDQHLVTANLKLRTEFDIRDLKKVKSYRGMRHASGLPVRGQRTRSNFRRGKSLGVQKKKVKQT
ncbi:30S ribosomal protein S13 [archaeon]|nr:30S ribosomal protein S13 [archaeon]